MNILTVDLEEWFHLLDFDVTQNESSWNNFEVRIYENTDRILQILNDTNTKATFFIIGWIAKTYPDIVKRISQYYEIGSHTMTHQLVWKQDPDNFRNDVTASIRSLEDITGKKIECFRAPGYSIRESEKWAFEILHELGITADCSVFPAKHAHGGMPSYVDVKPAIIEYNGTEIKEFPVSSIRTMNKNIIFSGGGYFRLFPYFLIKRWSNKLDYNMSYIHPRDLDSGQPMLEGLSLSRKFKSYVGIKSAEYKLRKYLTDFRFVDIKSATNMIDWENVPRIKL